DRTWPTKPAAAPRAALPNVKAFLGDMLQTARDYLGGVTLKDVTSAMRSGKSLGDIANDKGKSRDGLVAALTTAANTRIDKAVADNKLTADQAATLKTKVAAEIATFVDRKAPAKSTTGTTTKTPYRSSQHRDAAGKDAPRLHFGYPFGRGSERVFALPV